MIYSVMLSTFFSIACKCPGGALATLFVFVGSEAGESEALLSTASAPARVSASGLVTGLSTTEETPAAVRSSSMGLARATAAGDSAAAVGVCVDGRVGVWGTTVAVAGAGAEAVAVTEVEAEAEAEAEAMGGLVGAGGGALCRRRFNKWSVAETSIVVVVVEVVEVLLTRTALTGEWWLCVLAFICFVCVFVFVVAAAATPGDKEDCCCFCCCF